jgi:hypothetical protein
MVPIEARITVEDVAGTRPTVANPSLEMAATAGADEVHVADFVKS